MVGITGGHRSSRRNERISAAAWFSGRSESEFAAGVANTPAEGVQDHAEPELELVSEVVAGLQDVLGRHVNEVRVRVGGELLQYRLGNFDDRVRPVCTLYDTVLY
jgi:hypothetical protein